MAYKIGSFEPALGWYLMRINVDQPELRVWEIVESAKNSVYQAPSLLVLDEFIERRRVYIEKEWLTLVPESDIRGEVELIEEG